MDGPLTEDEWLHAIAIDEANDRDLEDWFDMVAPQEALADRGAHDDV